MTTLSSLTGATASVATTVATLTDEGKINKKNRNLIITTAAATTITGVGGNSLNEYETKKIYKQYADAYIDSMSDEELEAALVKLDLLEEEMIKNNDTKTI